MVRKLSTEEASLAAMRELRKLGIAIAAIMRMMATTINNSIRENPACLIRMGIPGTSTFQVPVETTHRKYTAGQGPFQAPFCLFFSSLTVCSASLLAKIGIKCHSDRDADKNRLHTVSGFHRNRHEKDFERALRGNDKEHGMDVPCSFRFIDEGVVCLVGSLSQPVTGEERMQPRPRSWPVVRRLLGSHG